MQNTDTGLASLVNCPICPVADGPEPKMRPDLAEAGGARPGGAHFRPIGPDFSGPGRAVV